MSEEAKAEAEKILESLSQEERLKLLERLIQGASEAHEENLTVEERLTRLENAVLGSGSRGRIMIRRFRSGQHWMSDAPDWCCC